MEPTTRFPFRIYTIALLLIELVLATLCWHSIRSYQVYQKEISREYQLKELAGRITYLDEVLTMSARMSAATGDPAWEERYHRFEPELTSVIQEVQRLAPEAYSDRATAQLESAIGPPP